MGFFLHLHRGTIVSSPLYDGIYNSISSSNVSSVFISPQNLVVVFPDKDLVVRSVQDSLHY